VKVQMQGGGPHDGEVYNVQSRAEDLHVDGKAVPIYWDSSKDEVVAKWDEARDSK
jgi:hypothetical protein